MIKPNGEKSESAQGAHRDNLVFEIDLENMTDYPNGDRLPGITVTKRVFDDEGNPNGRACVTSYPYRGHEFPYPDYDDEDGDDALYYGGCYYDEGMSYTDPADREKRVDCFRATEVLYRHSAGRGNAVANLCLGYVYSYDRCEGNYWRDPSTLGAEEDCKQPYPREHRAFECLSIAAEAGIPEACYKLGDMFKHGIGCDPDAVSAYSWYSRASQLAPKGERPVILGSISLRLADCFEEGFGCEQSFLRALQMYRQAITALDIAVEHGETWYEKALASARAGEKRCLQEIAQ